MAQPGEKFAFRKLRGQRVENLDPDRAGIAYEFAPRPEQSGVERNGQALRIYGRIELHDSEFVVRRSTRRAARPFWEDDDLPPLGERLAGALDHSCKGAMARVAIDKDHPALPHAPAEQRQP